MIVRAPLINPITAHICRLDIQSTWAANPPGTPDAGYDDLYREPIVSRTAGVRTVTRIEMAEVAVPAQVETQSFEQLQAALGGDNPATNLALVLHRRDLARLGYLDANNKCVFKPGDRLDRLSKGGSTILTWDKPLYVWEVRPRSWGFGPTGYDLEIIYTTHRSTDPARP